MKDKEIIAALPSISDDAPFRISRIETVNHKPHLFCITPRHVAYASDHCGGSLGEEACEKGGPCGIGRPGSPIKGEQACQLSYREHTSEKAILIEVSGDYPKLQDVPGLHAWLLQAKDIAEANGIAGFAFTKKRAQKVEA